MGDAYRVTVRFAAGEIALIVVGDPDLLAFLRICLTNDPLAITVGAAPPDGGPTAASIISAPATVTSWTNTWPARTSGPISQLVHSLTSVARTPDLR